MPLPFNPLGRYFWGQVQDEGTLLVSLSSLRKKCNTETSPTLLQAQGSGAPKQEPRQPEEDCHGHSPASTALGRGAAFLPGHGRISSRSLYTISQVSFGNASPEILLSANTLHNAQGFLPRQPFRKEPRRARGAPPTHTQKSSRKNLNPHNASKVIIHHPRTRRLEILTLPST